MAGCWMRHGIAEPRPGWHAAPETVLTTLRAPVPLISVGKTGFNLPESTVLRSPSWEPQA